MALRHAASALGFFAILPKSSIAFCEDWDALDLRRSDGRLFEAWRDRTQLPELLGELANRASTVSVRATMAPSGPHPHRGGRSRTTGRQLQWQCTAPFGTGPGAGLVPGAKVTLSRPVTLAIYLSSDASAALETCHGDGGRCGMRREWVCRSFGLGTWHRSSCYLTWSYQQVLAGVDFCLAIPRTDGRRRLAEPESATTLPSRVGYRAGGERFVKGNYPRWLPGRIQWPFLAGRR